MQLHAGYGNKDVEYIRGFPALLALNHSQGFVFDRQKNQKWSPLLRIKTTELGSMSTHFQGRPVSLMKANFHLTHYGCPVYRFFMGLGP